VPEGATKEQLKVMLQNLLAERFKLTIHREKKEMAVYDLVVAKGGHKMKEAAPEEPGNAPQLDGAGRAAVLAPPPPPPPVPGSPVMGGRMPMQLDKDGFPILPKLPGGRGPRTMFMNGRARMQADSESMEDFARMLSLSLGKPVTNGTGLKGNYEFTLTWDGASGGPVGLGRALPPPGIGGVGVIDGGTPLSGVTDDSGLPTIFGAVQSQLGLKLDQKKAQIEIIVVDHTEKAPTEN
jgi:uncharacterized protein (TIGR03435 family)